MYIKRPPMPAHLKKSEWVQIRVTKSEKSEIRKQALKAGLEISAYFKKAVSLMESQG